MDLINIFFVSSMATITEGVEFDTVAREWRCKWSGDNDKKSLAEAQKALNEILAEVKAVDGFKKVDRVVCGGCLDFKVSDIRFWLDQFSAVRSICSRSTFFICSTYSPRAMSF